MAASAWGAELSEATRGAWDAYISSVQARQEQRQNGDRPFLWIDESPTRAARLRHNEIMVSPASEHTPKRVPSGMIHDWIAASFIPAASINQAIASLRDYDKYCEIYKPAVIQSKTLDAEGDEDRFALRLISKSVMAKRAVDAEFNSSYWRSGNRACRIATIRHLHEIEDYGQKNQREMPE